MKNIELTEDHKSKLLEMCKELFPEYVIYTADNDGFIEGEQWVGDQNMGEDRPVNEFNIHWFEFCTTYLLDKLHPDNDKQSKDNWSMDLSDKDYVILKIIVRKKHPVDYLYEEFLKLK